MRDSSVNLLTHMNQLNENECTGLCRVGQNTHSEKGIRIGKKEAKLSVWMKRIRQAQVVLKIQN